MGSRAQGPISRWEWGRPPVSLLSPAFFLILQVGLQPAHSAHSRYTQRDAQSACWRPVPELPPWEPAGSVQGQQGQKLQHRAGFHRLVPLTNNLALETKGPARKVMVPESATPRPESVREWKVPSRTEMALWGPSCSRVPSSHQWASGPPARDTSQENVATSPAKTSTFCKPRTRHGAASVQEGERRGAGGALGLWGHPEVHHAGGSLGPGSRSLPRPAGTPCSQNDT